MAVGSEDRVSPPWAGCAVCLPENGIFHPSQNLTQISFLRIVCVFLIWDLWGKGPWQWPRAEGKMESHTFRFLTTKCVASAISLKCLGPNFFMWSTWLGCLLSDVSLFVSHLLSQKFEFCPRTHASSNLENSRLNLDKLVWPWKISKTVVLFA